MATLNLIANDLARYVGVMFWLFVGAATFVASCVACGVLYASGFLLRHAARRRLRGDLRQHRRKFAS
jgi:hypothetical protein